MKYYVIFYSLIIQHERTYVFMYYEQLTIISVRIFKVTQWQGGTIHVVKLFDTILNEVFNF